MVADDLDGVLVCTDGTVSAQTPELAADGAGCSGIGSGVLGQRVTGNVVDDADGEAVLRLVGCEVLVYGKDALRSGILGAETVAAADDLNITAIALGE